MNNEKSIKIKEEQKEEMCPEPTTMFLGDPLGGYWSTNHLNGDSKLNFGWDENENNNAVLNNLLHTILEAESECCPPPLLVPKKELLPDDTLGISCLSVFIKEDPELILEADETENIFKLTPSGKKVEFDELQSPGWFLQDPLQIKDPSFLVKQEVELKLDVDGFEQKVQVVPSSVNIKEETEDGVNKQYLEDPLRFDDPGLHIKQDPELLLDVDGSEHNFLEDPLHIYDPGLHIKQDPELQLDVDGSEHNVVASRSYASNSTRLLQSSESCDSPFEEITSQGVSHSEMEMGSEESTHIATFREEEEEEESLTAPRLKCSGRENKCQLFSCSFCLQSFSSKYRLIIHVFVHIDGVQPPKYVCMYCGEVFRSYDGLKKHLKYSEAHQESSAKEDTFDCSVEHGNFFLPGDQDDSTMDQTGRQCLSNATRISFTDKCNTHITTPNAEIRDRNDNNGTSDTTGEVNASTVPHLGKRSHNCHFCGKSFIKLDHFKTHTLIHTGTEAHKCDICGKSFTLLCNLKTHTLIHTGIRPHKCQICGKSFTLMGHLKRHTLVHTGSRPHTCDICGKSFSLMYNLKTHTLIHTGMKLHTCDICGKSFSLMGNLKTHALIHTGTQPHKCDICGKSFNVSGNLQKHALIHTGIKPHKCDICGKSFTKRDNLKTHILIHTGTKPHKCNVCGKSFTVSGNLQKHALTHTGIKPHKCDICGKSFTKRDYLKTHTLIHIGTKPNKCNICGKSFTLSGNLKLHTLIHSGIKPHKCDICGKSFTLLRHLKRHILVHTRTNPTQL